MLIDEKGRIAVTGSRERFGDDGVAPDHES
jgi:hypothetical protein